MADSSIIREYLVSLGFKVDDKTWKKFESGLAKGAAAATKFAGVIEATTVAVGAGVLKMASDLDNLYWASIRIGSSAGNIRAYTYAMTQLGGTAAGARGSLEAVAMFLRTNPGAAGWLQRLGVNTRGPNGQLRDTALILQDLGKRLREMPLYRANQYAQLLGIDYNTLLAMERGTAGYSREYQAFAKSIGVDLTHSAESSNRFMTSIRELRAEVGLLALKVGGEFIDRWGPSLRSLLIWLAAHQREIVTGVELWTTRIVRLGSAVFGFLMKAADLFLRLDKATHGWSTALIAIAALLHTSGLLGLVALNPELAAAVGGIMALIAALAFLAADFQTWQDGGNSQIDWGPWASQIGSIVTDLDKMQKVLGKLGDTLQTDFGPTLNAVFKTMLDWIDTSLKSVTHLAAAFDDLLHGRFSDAVREGALGTKDAVIAAAIATNPFVAVAANQLAGAGAPVRGANPSLQFGKVMKFFQDQGWTAAQAAGIAANLQAESQFNPAARGDGGQARGIAQWHPDRQADYEAWARQNGRPNLANASLADQLAFVQFELTKGRRAFAGRALRGAGDAGAAARIISMQYEGPKDKFGEAARRSALAERGMREARVGDDNRQHVEIHQTNNTTIHGDKSNFGNIMRDYQRYHDRSNGDLLRNLKGATH